MLVEKVDIERISSLLDSLPAKMEIISIDLTDGYTARLVAGEKELYQAEFNRALDKLNAILAEYDKLDVKNKLLKE